MEKGKYAGFTTNQLQKRKKYASVLLMILIAAIVIDGLILVYGFVTGDGFINALFAAVVACFVIFIPIYISKKRIERELKTREGR